MLVKFVCFLQGDLVGVGIGDLIENCMDHLLGEFLVAVGIKDDIGAMEKIGLKKTDQIGAAAPPPSKRAVFFYLADFYFAVIGYAVYE